MKLSSGVRAVPLKAAAPPKVGTGGEGAGLEVTGGN